MQPVLLEREAELRALGEALDAAAHGQGRTVLVSGEAGIGKTSLLRAFAEEAREHCRLWAGACEDLLTSRTLGPFRDIARQVGGPLHEALAEAEGPGRVVDVLLGELAYPLAPTVVVIEDLHWADDATLDVARLLARRIGGLPSLLVLSYREHDRDPAHPLQRVLGSLLGPTTLRLALAPLSPAAVAAIAGEASDPAEIHRVSGGNPFFVTEVVAAGDGRVPPTIRDAVLGRLLQLSPPTRAALELLSVVPAAVDRPLAEALLGDDMLLLAEAEERGVLRADAQRVRFRHELTRRTLAESLPASRRLLHNRRVTEALVAADADPARIVHHAVAAGDGDRVVAHGPAVARQAARTGSHREAASHHAQTLRFAHLLPDETTAALRAEHAYELYHLRRFAEAAAEARTAVRALERIGDPEPLVAALVTQSRATYWAGDPATARAAAERAVAVCEPLGRTRLLASAYIALAHVLMQCDDTEAITWAERARTLGAELGREDVVLQALGYLGTVRMGRGDPLGERDTFHALRLAEAREDDVAITRLCANLVRDLLRLGRVEEADRYVEQGLSHARRVEFFHGIYLLRTLEAELAVLHGRWDEAQATLEGLRATFPDAGVSSSLLLAWLGRLAARRGTEGAGALLDTAWAMAEATGELQWIGPVAAARIEAAWLSGDRAAAADAAGEALALADRLGHPWLCGELRRYLARAGHPREPQARSAEAWALGLSGRWAAAADAWARLGNPYERALELLEAPEEGAVTEAVELLDGLEAAPAARIARQRLRALGVTRIPRGPQAQTRAHPAGLTSRQDEVLALVVDGLTNAEIAERLVLSVRTIDHHVAAILDKLGVASRREAARAAADRGLLSR